VEKDGSIRVYLLDLPSVVPYVGVCSGRTREDRRVWLQGNGVSSSVLRYSRRNWSDWPD
jgi:hypothetical protein